MLDSLLFEFCACHKWEHLYNVRTTRHWGLSLIVGFQQLCFKAHFLVVVTSVMLPICLDNLVLENISFLICQHNHDIDFETF